MEDEHSQYGEVRYGDAFHDFVGDVLQQLQTFDYAKRCMFMSLICSEVSELDGKAGICWGRIPCQT